MGVPAPPAAQAPAFYEPIGDFQGDLYRRNAFATGTRAEVAALKRHLRLEPGAMLLDIGCGDGRHLRALAADGIRGVGIDVSEGLLRAARDEAAREQLTDQVRFVRADARRLADLALDGYGTFDAATSLCQGAFGTSPATDPAVVGGLAGAVRPGGRVVVTAFHALFAVRHLVEGDAYDPVHGVHHQISEVRGPDDTRRQFDLWTAAYTVREVTALLEDQGLVVERVVGAEPGRYDGTGVALDDPELLIVARQPGQSQG